MPELPEVENVCLSLKKALPKHGQLTNTHFWRKDLRFQLPISELKKIAQTKFSPKSQIEDISRRAKFIQIKFDEKVIISHLGMTGRWSLFFGDLKKYKNQKHDHMALQFNHNLWLIYNDPRRFGFISVVKKTQIEDYFNNYGFEPLEMSEEDVENLWLSLKKSQAPVKNFIMNQKHIVGVGNIYACEALFAAQVNPFKKSANVSRVQYDKLLNFICEKLTLAIAAGGSTIQSYRNLDAQEGLFQKSHLVYGLEGHLCPACKKQNIKRKAQAGRSTFFCSACQV